ncbi:MAG: hypothetical protein AAB855_04900, partial [Patescibacteria group bacterium]
VNAPTEELILKEKPPPKKPRAKKSTPGKSVEQKTPTRRAIKRVPQKKQTAQKVSLQPTAAALPMTPAPTRTEIPRSTPPSPAPRAETMEAKRSMSAMACFIYGAVVCLVGTIGLGLLLGLVVLPPLVEQYSAQARSSEALLSTTNTTPPQLPTAPQETEQQQEQYGFYGTLLSKEENVLTVQELLPPLPLEEGADLSPSAKTFVVRVDAQTEYTHQKPREESDLTAPLFSPVQGSLDAISNSAYLFVNTREDPAVNDTVSAAHVVYSELSPFAE